MLLNHNHLHKCAPTMSPLHNVSSPFKSLLPHTPRQHWLPRCKPLSSRRLSSLHTQTAAALLAPSRIVACSASKEGSGSSTLRHRPADSSQLRSKQPNKQRPGAHNRSSVKEQGSATKEECQRGRSSAQQHGVQGKQSQKGSKGPGGNRAKHSIDGAGEQSVALQRSSRRQWRSGQQGSEVGNKRTREGMSPPSSSSSSSSKSSSSSSNSSSKRPKTRETSDKGVSPRVKSGQIPSMHECIQDAKAAGTPQQSFEALYSLGKRVQEDQNGKRRYTMEESDGIVAAAHVLAAQILGSQAPTSLGSSTTTTTTSSTINSHVSSSSPVLQLNSMQLSLTIWALSQLVGADSRVRSRHLRELVDAVAARAAGSSVMNKTTDDACMHWSRLLHGIAKMGSSCRDSNAVQQLFEAGADVLPQMLRRKQPCAAQNVSNPLWALAKAEYGGSLQQLVSEVASNLGWVTKDAKPQNWSNAVWALATLHSQKVVLGEQSAVSKIISAGVEGMVQQRWRAKQQELSNTLWALATLDHNPGNATINTLATTMAERSSKANPQALANTLWALATLDHNPGYATVNTLATAMAERSSTAKSLDLSQTLWALATLDHNPGNTTINCLATAMAKRCSTAKPQGLSNTLWALAKLGHNPGNATINTLATTMAERSSTAEPQHLSQTLWALAKLGHNPGNATVNTLATAMAKGSSMAKPQELSNTLWALATLDHNPGNTTINTLATAMAERSSMAKPQELSNALQALGSLCWYQPEVYSTLVERLLHSISSSMPEAIGQDFSNALFSCALSCHFDSDVDALAAWGSQQGLQLWTEQAVSNTLYAWAMLAATAGGNTANMRTLAQRLFKEANRRGAARFSVENDLGKLYGAHLEALHLDLGGLTDSTLLQAVQKNTAMWQQEISTQESHNTSFVAAALQGHFKVQAAMVQGYHTLLVPHNSRSIAIVVTNRYRDYLNHPAGQLYGKTALRVKHVERGCDGLILCDESKLKGSSIEQLREMLVQHIEQAIGS